MRRLPREIVLLLVSQLCFAVTLSLIFLFFAGRFQAVSALLGGFVCIIPSWFFALLAFRHRGAHAAKRIVSSFYMGEGFKLFLTVGLFTLVFKFLTVSPVVFLGAFIAVQSWFWLAPLFLKKTSAAKK